MVSDKITPQRLEELHKKQGAIDLIDVRTPGEFASLHIPFARNVPLDQIHAAPLPVGEGAGRERPLYVICKSGARGSKACQQLAASGYDQVINVEGGVSAWDKAGLPVIRGQGSISLDRQVRITAGGMIMVFAALGYFVHPLWIVAAGLMGGGLFFAGVTDSCAMGVCLARMPWNQVDPGDANGASARAEALNSSSL